MRQIHEGGTLVEGAGTFRIGHGTTLLARVLARVFALPPAAASVPTRLIIRPDGEGETWQRTFGAHRVVSHQRSSDGLLVERFGPLEFRFRLRAAGGGIAYEQAAVALRLGRWRAPLPRWLAPQVAARELPEPTELTMTNVRVRVTTPLCGDLLSYEGHMSREYSSK